ncbi:hypothetical protein HPP92_018322 [Vanilla planifolia]|uniref:Hydroxymethylglutaryl-CoA reductase (NADPH) n=1 Tax=Vanilla planifolia TaxID=51239 RepID=A0A835QAX1_VANPL|nr:hypothetical protein HPP92_018322 [Vanilla planifolia]
MGGGVLRSDGDNRGVPRGERQPRMQSDGGIGGASSVLFRDGMTRAPVVRFPYGGEGCGAQILPGGIRQLRHTFCRLQQIKQICQASSTGDAMGMNMVSKGVQNVLDYLQNGFPDMDVISISSNFCSDKKPAAVNWIEGRGKSVVCEAVIKEDVVKKVLKTTVSALVELNTIKNLAGSAVAGALGGYNAHASNIVTAIFIATGQDPPKMLKALTASL